MFQVILGCGATAITNFKPGDKRMLSGRWTVRCQQCSCFWTTKKSDGTMRYLGYLSICG
jgi:predicted ATPase